VAGEPAKVISAAAFRVVTDLIMWPPRGTGPFRRFLIGSVTAKVLNDALSPVWTSVHREDRSLPEPLPSGPVLCPVNLDAESVPLLRFAAELAADWVHETARAACDPRSGRTVAKPRSRSGASISF
jgi:hypothetical protein